MHKPHLIALTRWRGVSCGALMLSEHGIHDNVMWHVYLALHASLIQRASEMAPECNPLRELRQRLTSEGYDRLDAHLGELGIQRQLRSHFNEKQGQRSRGPQNSIKAVAE